MTAHFHSVPGRLRVHIPQVKGSLAAARAIEAKISRVPGVSSVETRKLTGSVVIHYDPTATNSDTLLAVMGMAPHAVAAAFVCSRGGTAANGPAKLTGKIAEAVIWHLIQKAAERALPLAIAAIL